MVLVVKNPPASPGDVKDPGLIPGSGRSPGKGNGYPLQYSCLGNLMDRGAWRATVHTVTKSRKRLKRLNTHAQEVRRLGQEKQAISEVWGYWRTAGMLGAEADGRTAQGLHRLPGTSHACAVEQEAALPWLLP